MHRARVINENAQGYGIILVQKRARRLRGTVLPYAEVAATQVRDGPAFFVHRCAETFDDEAVGAVAGGEDLAVLAALERALKGVQLEPGLGLVAAVAFHA